jgi:hypothetical protein
MINFIVVLFISIIVEVILIQFFTKTSLKKITLVVVAANLITNPLANYIIYLNMLNEFVVFPLFIPIEIAVVIFEAFLYKKYLDFSFMKALGVSIFINLGSIYIGTIAYLFIYNIAEMIMSIIVGNRSFYFGMDPSEINKEIDF